MIALARHRPESVARQADSRQSDDRSRRGGISIFLADDLPSLPWLRRLDGGGRRWRGTRGMGCTRSRRPPGAAARDSPSWVFPCFWTGSTAHGRRRCRANDGSISQRKSSPPASMGMGCVNSLGHGERGEHGYCARPRHQQHRHDEDEEKEPRLTGLRRRPHWSGARVRSRRG